MSQEIEMSQSSGVRKSDVEVVQNYTPPQYRENAFHCPQCNVYAHQNWYGPRYTKYYNHSDSIKECDVAFCVRCGKYSLWIKGKMIYPLFSTAPLPIPEMPKTVKELYSEARAICDQSPRGACALLRLAIEYLVEELLSKKEKDLNKAIGNLVKKGLPEKIQKALDVVRVTGNNAVHPGTIDRKDDPKIVNSLFKLVNFICEKMITEGNEIDNIYSSLPETSKETIEKRDKKSNN